MEDILNKLLQVDDVLYEYGNYGVYNKVTVQRVTPKTAFLSDGFRCPRMGWNGEQDCFPKQGESAAVIETPELVKEWFRRQSLEKLKSYNFGKLSHEQLVEIIKILS